MLLRKKEKAQEGAKKNVHYLTGKETRAIAKSNARTIRALEKKKKRSHVDESEYLTTMRDENNIVEFDNLHTYFFTDAGVVKAVDGVSFDIPKGATVGVVGESGCGKTTLLNIIGGLDQYTSGDLIINGQSTKQYKSADWDIYRNHSVGFIFQSYNLIPHQTVLANVELALTLSGVSKAERRRRAEDALRRVGLGDQMKKKPNQMSGGQMQRVAIARAIVNDPDILLADEPTGALDTATSIQIMEILKEIAKDKLVIMVTHNPQLAEQYSTRIVRLLDGVVTDDSAPIRPDERGFFGLAGRIPGREADGGLSRLFVCGC